MTGLRVMVLVYAFPSELRQAVWVATVSHAILLRLLLGNTFARTFVLVRLIVTFHLVMKFINYKATKTWQIKPASSFDKSSTCLTKLLLVVLQRFGLTQKH